MARRYDLRYCGGRVIVSALETLQVHHGQAAVRAHGDSESRIHNGVKRRSHHWEGEVELADVQVNVDEFRVHGDCPGDNGHIVKPVRRPQLPVSS